MKSLFSLFNKISFGGKLRLLAILISALTVITAGVVLLKVISIKGSNYSSLIETKCLEATKDLQLNVSQLWQYCTDASLTQRSEMIGSEIQSSYESAVRNISLLDSLKSEQSNPNFDSAKLNAELVDLLSAGKKMVLAYAESKESGDAEMAGFDKACNAIIKDLNSLAVSNSGRATVDVNENEANISETIYFIITGIIVLLFLTLPPQIYMTRYADGFFKKLSVLIEEISNGVFINRFTNMQFEDDLGQLAWRFNEMIDQIETFLKETSTSVEYAANKKYFRTPISTGLNGMFVVGIESVKKSIKLQESSFKAIENQSAYLSRSVNNMLQEMEKFAQGDLTVKVTPEKQGDDISQLFEGFNRVVVNIKQIITSVIDAVEATASASAEISSSSEQMAAGAQEQSSQTTEMASAIEQMTKTIIESTRITSNAAETAKKSGNIAKEGGKIVNQTIEGMNRIAGVVNQSAVTVETLGHNSDKIGEIAQVINDIADQTNLLALNAAIEAARAGEQGRGFAVVADEVRKLAERTTKATKEIADMIGKIQVDTADAVKSIKSGTVEVEKGKSLADQAGHSLTEIITQAEEVVTMVSQVANASNEQSNTAELISQNIEGISNVADESAQGVQQIAKAAEDMNRLTVNLQELVSKFKLDHSFSRRNVLHS